MFVSSASAIAFAESANAVNIMLPRRVLVEIFENVSVEVAFSASDATDWVCSGVPVANPWYNATVNGEDIAVEELFSIVAVIFTAVPCVTEEPGEIVRDCTIKSLVPVGRFSQPIARSFSVGVVPAFAVSSNASICIYLPIWFVGLAGEVV